MRVPPSAPSPQPSRPRARASALPPDSPLWRNRPPEERGGGKRARPPLAGSSGLRRGSREALGAGGARGRGVEGGAAHSPHSDACPGDEQSHASGTCEDVVRCPQTRQLEQASVLILPFPLGQGLRRVRRSESPAGSPPSPWSSAALCPRWGGGGCLWPCVSFGFATAVQPHPTVPGEELGFEGTVRGRRAVTIIE